MSVYDGVHNVREKSVCRGRIYLKIFAVHEPVSSVLKDSSSKSFFIDNMSIVKRMRCADEYKSAWIKVKQTLSSMIFMMHS